MSTTISDADLRLIRELKDAAEALRFSGDNESRRSQCEARVDNAVKALDIRASAALALALK